MARRQHPACGGAVPHRSVLARAAPVAAPAQTFTAVAKGQPHPLGPSKAPGGVNFALYAEFASKVALCLFDTQNQLLREVELDPAKHKTGEVWHVLLEGLPGSGVCYAYRVWGSGGWDTGNRWEPDRWLIDPYAPLLNGRRWFGRRDAVEQFKPKVGSVFTGTFDFDEAPFDWGNEEEVRPRFGLKDLVIYEMPVRSFTADPSSGLAEGLRGTYLGVAEKAEYLRSLGVNAVELLPVFEWDELEFQRLPNPRDHMVNIWGYSHINFFAPMSRFAANGGGPVAARREFKQMVKTLHAAGIEVILDVVYNHTVEGDDKDPYVLSFRGIENKTYYITDTTKYVQMQNFSGCGNTVNANHPVVSQLIVDSLVQWVEEYHVDGFRFDLASCLCRDERGHPMPAPPLIRTIAKHPVLSRVKLIAEPWDIGMYQVGSFPNWDVWAEWNGKYRDDVRRFIKGDPGVKGGFATRIAGSSDLYQTNNRKPYHSINFVTAHDGFSLYDMVTYNGKRNDANGERNMDGTNDNFSWNCGVEGPTGDAGVVALRSRQMRNYLTALMLSQGTPMMVMGDEIAMTHGGNNNWYGHDKPFTWLQWGSDGNGPGIDSPGLRRFTSELIAFRRSHPALGRDAFPGPSDIVWHENNWGDPESRFLAFTIRGQGGPDIYAAFNSHHFAVNVALPPPPGGQRWVRLIDTNLPPPRDITPGGNKGVEGTYSVAPWSCIVLMAV